jgi:hypothetical protein
MRLDWLAPTTQGVMVGDYISTSFLAGQQRVVSAFPIGSAPTGGAYVEPMFAALEKVRGGTNAAGHGQAQVHSVVSGLARPF